MKAQWEEEPDKINGVDVEYRGSIFVGDMNIGIYLMKKEIDINSKLNTDTFSIR